MRIKSFIHFVLFFLFVFSSANCKKHRPLGNPVDQLPAETTTGTNTFGCLINGQIFLPKGLSLSPILQCAYQYVNTNYSRGYFFQLSAANKSNSSDVFGLGIFTDSLPISVGSFVLKNSQKGNAYGQYSRFNNPQSNVITTQNDLRGELVITKFDEVNQIVSGTFWFSVVKSPGDTLKITDGRFDMKFTK